MVSNANSGILQKFCCLSIEDPDYIMVEETPAQKIVKDVLVNGVGKELFLSDFAALARVCRAWKTMIQPDIDKTFLEILEKVSFGKDKWLSIPGVFSVSEEIAFSEDQKKELITKLKSTCKIFNQADLIQPHRFQNDTIKRRWQTHRLIFFPKDINGQPRTINSQNKLFHFIKEEDNGTAFNFIVGDEEDEFRNESAPKSYWGLVTLDVVPGSRGTTHDTKERLLQSKGYKVLTPNDAATSNLIMNLGFSKEEDDYFFGKEGRYWVLTATTKLYDGYRLVVGAAASSGPEMSNSYCDNAVNVGAAGVAEVP